ncbi:MAG: MBL fold metallo-hydrolase [bacterium]|nr:MBL fold metallo-hydrolase [bacterium]
MDSTITEIAPSVFRISTFHADYGMQFNQFLVRDDEPLLFHTGFRALFPTTCAAVRSVLDPATLRWITFSHFEGDESGALNEWLAVAPRAQAACGLVGAVTSVNDFTGRPARVLEDGEVLELGTRRLQFLRTPQVPHGWDASLLFEQTERTLFCSDLFFQPADPPPLSEGDIVGPARDAILANRSTPFANDLPYTPHTDATIARLAALAPRTLAVMHGSSYRGDGGRALRELGAVIAAALGGRER